MSAEMINRDTYNNIKEMMGEEYFAELVETFLKDTANLIEGLQRDLKEENIDSFRRNAHSLKSNSASLGAERLSSLGLECEIMGKSGDLSSADAKLEQIRSEFELVKEEIINLG